MNAMMKRTWSDIPTAIADTIMAVALTALGMFSAAFRLPLEIQSGGFGGGSVRAHVGSVPHAPVEPSWAAPARFGLVAASFLPLALRRRYPLTVLAVVAVVSGINDLVPGPPSLVFLAPLIALYTVGTLKDRRTLAIAGSLTAVVQLAASLPSYGTSLFWANAIRIVALVAVAAALGDATRNRRAYVVEVEQRAIEAERNRDEEARLRVEEERLRIARELHDVTAHSLSIIAVQSGAAAHVIDSNPAEARRSLEAIRHTSKEALDELRAMLGVLRSADETGAPLAPVPGLARVIDLATPMRDAGIDVTFRLSEHLDDVPAVVDASAYRIVQEALTNIVRHAGPCSVAVSVQRHDDDLSIEVVDSGRGPSLGILVFGHGLSGMRERVVALGGSFEAAPRADGTGFRVAALLPLGTRGGRSS